MSSTRIWQCGAELGSAAVEVSALRGAVAASTDQARSGLYSLRTSAASAFAYRHPTPLGHIHAGWMLRHAGAAAAATPYLVCLTLGSSPILSLWWDPASAAIQASAGPRTASVFAAASDAPIRPTGRWRHWGLDVRIAADGWIDLYANGVLALRWEGDTRGAGDAFDHIWFGGPGYLDAQAHWAENAYWDDLYIDACDGESTRTPPANHAFYLMTPVATGTASQWMGSDGNQTDNYALVDDVPHDGNATYLVAADPSALREDRYVMSGVSLVPGERVTAVIPVAVARAADFAADLALVACVDDQTAASDRHALADTYRQVWTRLPDSPSGDSWDEDTVNAVEIGVRMEPWI